jgi:DNA polymerase-3 subunit epsilon
MSRIERAELNLDLKHPIVFFDLETTGLNLRTERIIELALVKVLPDKQVSKLWLGQRPQRLSESQLLKSITSLSQ